MAAISLFWYTNMAAVTSDENDLLVYKLMSQMSHFVNVIISKLQDESFCSHVEVFF
jgi:hypothetical protein